MNDREALIELAKRVDECVVALANDLGAQIRTGAGQPVPKSIVRLHAFIDEVDPVSLEEPSIDGGFTECSYWPTGRHVFRGHADGSTDPCKCGARWNGPKPAFPPRDPHRPESGLTVTVVDEAHERVNWCRIHNQKMVGVRSTGNWACEAYYDHEIKDGDCVLELRPRNEDYAEHPHQGKQ